MRILTTLAAAATLALMAATSAMACSGYTPQQNVLSPMPTETQQTVQTPAPAGALSAPTETAETDAAKTGEQPPVKAN